jgi:hypothetical protein
LLVCVRLHTFNYGHFKDGGRRVFKDFVVEKVLGRVYILYCWNEVYRNIVKTSYLWGGISEKNVPMMTKV